MVKTLWFKPQSSVVAGEPINGTLKQHALDTEWDHREAIALFHRWADHFNTEFRLDLKVPVISISPLPVRTYATYRPGRNGMGLLHEIVMNELYLTRPLAEQLATLLHEELHQWQASWGRRKGGKNGYHNQEFLLMAKRFGLVVDDRGHHLAIEPGPFAKLLAKYNVDAKTLPLAEEQPLFVKRPRGTSKLKKWTCTPGCTNVRCAVRLKAQCLKCGLEFVCEDDHE